MNLLLIITSLRPGYYTQKENMKNLSAKRTLFTSIGKDKIDR